METVFVLLFWFYDGDSNLVDSFVDVFKTYDSAFQKTLESQGFIILSSAEVEEKKNSQGSYGDPSFFEIRKCEPK